MEDVHKYFCIHCTRYVINTSPKLLAEDVNRHNNLLHPLDFSRWSAESILQSGWYTGPMRKLTEADRKFLTEAHIRWDSDEK